MITDLILPTESRMREIAREVFREEFRIESKKSEQFLDAPQAAEFIHASLSKLYRLTSLGEVPHMKRHGKLLFDKSELSAWVRASKKITVENCI
jgi:predicted DNA-binding transcriptional regulator AlpA